MDKRIIYAGGVLVLLLAAILIVKGRKTKGTSKIPPKPFPELRVERPKDPKKARGWVHPAMKKIDHIRVTKKGLTLELRRTKAGDGQRDFGEWKIVKPFTYDADTFAVRQVLQKLTSLQYWETSTNDAKQHGRLGVSDKNGLRLQVLQGDRSIADLYLGKERRTDLGQQKITYTYFRAAKQNTVWKVMGSFKALVKKEANDWRDPKILKLKRDDVIELSLSTKEGSLTVARDPKTKDRKTWSQAWKVKTATPPLPGGIEVSDVSRIASTLSYLRASSFEDKPTPAQSGLNAPTFSIGVTVKGDKTKGNKTYTVLFGKTIQPSKDDKKKVGRRPQPTIYVQIKGNPQVFLVQTSRLRSVLKTPQELRNRTVMQLEPGQKIVRLEVQKGKDTFLFNLGPDKKWKVEKPKDLKFDEKGFVRNLKSLATRFTAKAFSTEKDPTKTGLNKPTGKIVFTIDTEPPKPKPKTAQPKAKPRRDVVTILIGKEPKKRELYVQRQGTPDIFIISQHTLQRLWKGPDKWGKPKRPPRRPGAGMPGQMGGRMGGRGRMPQRMPRRMPQRMPQRRR